MNETTLLENKTIENVVNGAKQNTTVTINEDLLLK